MRSREATIAAAARALGFSRAGTAPLAPLPVGPFLAAWLAEGRDGELGFLARRTADWIDLRAVRPWARAVRSLADPYRPPLPPPGDWRATLTGRIAAYALGADYHARVGTLLGALAARLAAAFPGARFQAYVDTGPVLEREWAMRAGLGWIGKHTLLLDRTAGSYFFLAELFTDLELAASPLPADHCGRSEEHTSELQSQSNLVCRLLLEKKKKLCANTKKTTRVNSTHNQITYAIVCLKKQQLPWRLTDRLTPRTSHPPSLTCTLTVLHPD